jgi:hypothetical protein
MWSSYEAAALIDSQVVAAAVRLSAHAFHFAAYTHTQYTAAVYMIIQGLRVQAVAVAAAVAVVLLEAVVAALLQMCVSFFFKWCCN